MYKLLGGDGRQYGPVSPDQVRMWILERRLNARSLAQPEGAAHWSQLSIFPEFAAALAAAGPMPPAFAPTPNVMPQRTNGMAIASLVFGLLGLVCCPFFLFNLPGLIFGVVALTQLRNNPHEEGKGMAITGIVLSLMSLLVPFSIFAFGLLGSILERLG